jgi:hypothetical protein
LVRIDSPQGQYAKAGHELATITGDPKVFGTVYLNKRGVATNAVRNCRGANSAAGACRGTIMALCFPGIAISWLQGSRIQ